MGIFIFVVIGGKVNRIIIVCLVVCVCLVVGNYGNAAEVVKYHSVESIKYDLDNDGEQEVIERIFVGEDLELLPDSWVIRVISKDKSYLSEPIIEMPLFSGSSIEIINVSDKVAPIIALWYSAGAYTRAVELYKYDNGLVLVNNIGCGGYVFSDEPMRFEDIDSDGVLELIVLQRDWSNGQGAIPRKEIYNFRDGKYILSKENERV